MLVRFYGKDEELELNSAATMTHKPVGGSVRSIIRVFRLRRDLPHVCLGSSFRKLRLPPSGRLQYHLLCRKARSLRNVLYV